MGRAKTDGKPKRPQSGYMLYLASIREELKSENPEWKITDIAREGGKRWKALSDDEKAPFNDQANEAKEEYKEKLKDYQENHADDDESDEAPKRGKKRKAAKDPDAPKRPQTAYFLYLADLRPQLKEEFPDLKVQEVAKKAGERWAELSDEDKQPYHEKAAEAKKEYQKALAEYNKRSKKNDSEDEDEDEES